MTRIQSLLASSMGAKIGMAFTGILLSLFVVGHMMGNFTIYLGRDVLNGYAQKLQSLGPMLWVIRAAMLTIVVVHIWLALSLRNRNVKARPDRYVRETTIQATWASRSMVLTGLLVLAFVLLHLAHFTLHWLSDTPMLADGHVDVYAMVVAGFKNPLFTGIYVVAMVILGVHLFHALQSVFQTLGLRHPGYTPTVDRVCAAIAWLVALGYLSIPVTIILGITGAEAQS